VLFVHFQLRGEINALFAPIPGRTKDLFKKIVLNGLILGQIGSKQIPPTSRFGFRLFAFNNLF